MKVKFKRVCNNLLVIEHPENSSSALLGTTRIKFRFSNHACVICHFISSLSQKWKWLKVLIPKITLDKMIFACPELFPWHRGYGGVTLKRAVTLNMIELRNVKEVRGNYSVKIKEKEIHFTGKIIEPVWEKAWRFGGVKIKLIASRWQLTENENDFRIDICVVSNFN